MREREPDGEGQKGRIDPVLRWDEVEFRADGREPPEDPPPDWQERRRIWPWAALALVALAVALAVFRQPLAEALWPDTRVQRLLDDAEAALKRGRLTAEDGSGARERFEAAQALDSDRIEARTGLVRVGYAALQQAQAATRENRLEEAHQYLELARDLQVPRANINLAAEQLRTKEKESQSGGVDALLQQAQDAQAAAKPDGPDPAAALPLYQRVLELESNQTEALEGREDALSDLLKRAEERLKAGDVTQAAELIAQARRFDAGHADLPEAQATLASTLEQRRQQADKDLRSGRREEALTGYQAVIEAKPDDAAARQGIERIAAAYAQDASRKAADFDFDQARVALDKAIAIAPQSPAVKEAEQHLSRARQSQARLGSPASPHERERRVQTLLAEMAQAEERGDWLSPPGESAYDKLRAAQALAPGNGAVRQAAARLLPGVQRCFEDELRDNRVRRAQACQQAWQTLQPRDPRLAGTRRRLAEKWVAVGNERLGAGDVNFAANALREAQTLDAYAPGVADFAVRVRTAQAGGN
ncbi:hypothetical protein [Pseudoxanthomonas sp. UTMC 1351]|uniref:hypothetical protein n=1 Tax=Pseudoxanthomonas sp. UTMC 1351 TaxID=2695853 RepID=UPI0034CD3E45